MALRPPPWMMALSAVRLDVSTVPSGREEPATDMALAQAHSRRTATSNEVVAMTSGAAAARRVDDWWLEPGGGGASVLDSSRLYTRSKYASVEVQAFLEARFWIVPPGAKI
ncbi:hypothetical protein ZWY2020_050266 [Hordeum vulgare]|nr:hypothetical protein ZWY2020_050266 [Hordeum vulgare]